MANCKEKCVKDTQRLVKQATEEAGELGAYWLGCIMPARRLLPRAANIFRKDAEDSLVIDQDSDGEFNRILRATGYVGVDGSGGKYNRMPRIRAVGAGASVA